MKKIILVRHGKSAWDNPFLADHERPLAERGLRDLPVMSKRLLKREIKPDLFLTSTATRALETARIVAEAFNYPTQRIIQKKSLYHASSHEILSILKNQNDDLNLILIFGHNPGFNQLIEDLGGTIDNLPTSGQFAFSFETNNWSEISKKNSSFWFFDYPKK